jgi:hypothetical protein
MHHGLRLESDCNSSECHVRLKMEQIEHGDAPAVQTNAAHAK